jgi:hypothetical protein
MSLYPIYIDSSVAGAQLSIGTTNVSFVNIGNANCSTTVNGALNSTGTVSTGALTPASISCSGTLSSSGIITANAPIALGYAPTSITGTTQLGYNIVSTGSTVTLSGMTVVKSVILTAGIWLLSGNVRFIAPGTFAELSITTSTTLTDYSCASVAVGVNGMTLQVTRIINTNGNTYNLLAGAQANGGVVNVGFFAYRIA